MQRMPLGLWGIALAVAGCAEPAGSHRALSRTEIAEADSLTSAADLAEARLGVPADLVLAVAWVETSLGTRPADADDGHHAAGMHAPQIGIGGLRPWLDGDVVERAEASLGTSTAVIERDPVVGLLATAAILRKLAVERHGQPPPAAEPGAWHEVLADYAGLRADQARTLYASRVLNVLRRGLQATAVTGEVVTVRSRTVVRPEGVGAARAYSHPEYTGARWIPAREGHYEEGRSGHEITHIIIHTMQGTYEGAISWFQSESNPYRTATHYLIIRTV